MLSDGQMRVPVDKATLVKGQLGWEFNAMGKCFCPSWFFKHECLGCGDAHTSASWSLQLARKKVNLWGGLVAQVVGQVMWKEGHQSRCTSKHHSKRKGHHPWCTFNHCYNGYVSILKRQMQYIWPMVYRGFSQPLWRKRDPLHVQEFKISPRNGRSGKEPFVIYSAHSRNVQAFMAFMKSMTRTQDGQQQLMLLYTFVFTCRRLTCL